MSVTVDRGDARVLLSASAFPGLAEWTQQVLQEARRHPGFDEAEIFQPIPGLQDRLVLLLRFGATADLRAFLDSPGLARLDEEVPEGSLLRQVIAGQGSVTRPVSLVVGTRVDAARLESFKAWQAEMLEEERRFPGFLDSRVVEPVPGVSDEWTIVVKFDSPEHLDAWLDSEQRHRLMERIDPELQGNSVRKVSSSFEGWFGVDASAPPPPDWKQAVSVLLGLYPLVMLDSYFLIPRLDSLPLAVSILIVNSFNLTVLTYLAMPRITTVLKDWLYPPKGRSDVAGTAGVLAFVAAMVAFFLWWKPF